MVRMSCAWRGAALAAALAAAPLEGLGYGNMMDHVPLIPTVVVSTTAGLLLGVSAATGHD